MDVKELAHKGLLSDLFGTEPQHDPHPSQKYSEFAQSDGEYDAFDQGNQEFGQWSETDGETSSSYICQDDDDDIDSTSSSLVSQQDVPDLLLRKKTSKPHPSSKTVIYSGAQLLVDDSFGSAFVFEK